MCALICVLMVGGVLVFIRLIPGNSSEQRTATASEATANEAESVTAAAEDSEFEAYSVAPALTASMSQMRGTFQDPDAEEKEAALREYNNLGIAEAGDFVNIRETADAEGLVIGHLPKNGACDILNAEGEWSHIRSGQVEGYVRSDYLLTGETAKQRGMEQLQEMAVVTAESLNLRSSPELGYANIIGEAHTGERYPVLKQENGWIEVDGGFISAEYAKVRYALYEAVSLDEQTLALNRYQNLVISKVHNYLNVRSSPEDKGNSNIIGKMPGYAAGEVLDTLDGWYHVRSGSLEGYISADPQLTAVGQEAKALAYGAVERMAIIDTDRLNVRTEPSTDSSIWTQISKNERYHVIQQLDGWAQIELDTGGEGEETDGAYISTEDGNARVLYALAEAIPFSPVEEAAGIQSSLRSQIAAYAVQFVGNPYVWGGTSLTNGADCSGFVMSVMRKFGISLPRTSREQAQSGTGIDSSKMQAGDLIFYANSSGTVNHVALYIGNGQVVHASSRRTGIRISTWNYRTPKAIRRVL